MSVIICEERPTCRDQNVNRWYCHADSQGACPLARCGATQEPGDPSRARAKRLRSIGGE